MIRKKWIVRLLPFRSGILRIAVFVTFYGFEDFRLEFIRRCFREWACDFWIVF